MNRLRSILVGLDLASGSLTKGSITAAQQALRLADQSGASVEYLHSTYRGAEDSADAPIQPDALRQELEGALGNTAGFRAAEPILSEDRPWIAITRRVVEGKNDLVVVAKRNEQSGDSHKLGSVSTKLVRKCPGPVWVVKPEHELRHRSVLAATDLTPVGDLATEYGAFLAVADDCRLSVVHAWQLPLELQMSASRIGDEEFLREKDAIDAEARRHILAVPPVENLGERVKLFVGCGAPSSAILEVTQREDPDLVVMGTVSRGGIAGMLVGNTAEKLLGRLDCSLLTVKPADFVCPLHFD